MAVDTRSSLLLTHSFGYRGGTQLWTNRWHCTGPETITLEEFNTLVNAVKAAERNIYSDVTTLVRAEWADASTATTTNPHGLVTQSLILSQAGNVAVEAGVVRMPGDCALVARFSTDARTTKNHPIYLFKYVHDVFGKGNAAPDTPSTVQRANLQTYGEAWIEGFSDGTNTRAYCGPHGVVALTASVLTTIRHRDFPT